MLLLQDGLTHWADLDDMVTEVLRLIHTTALVARLMLAKNESMEDSMAIAGTMLLDGSTAKFVVLPSSNMVPAMAMLSSIDSFFANIKVCHVAWLVPTGLRARMVAQQYSMAQHAVPACCT